MVGRSTRPDGFLRRCGCLAGRIQCKFEQADCDPSLQVAGAATLIACCKGNCVISFITRRTKADKYLAGFVWYKIAVCKFVEET